MMVRWIKQGTPLGAGDGPGLARLEVVPAAVVMAVTLPAVFLLLDYWPLERLPVPHSAGNANEFWKSLRALVVEKMPLILMSCRKARRSRTRAPSPSRARRCAHRSLRRIP